MSEKTQQVEALIDKAAAAEKSEDAIRFSQAALNAAHTMQVLAETKKTEQYCNKAGLSG